MSSKTLKKALELAEQRQSLQRSHNVQGPAIKKNKKKNNKRKQQIEKKIKALEEAIHAPKDHYDQNLRFLTKSLQQVETEDLQKVRKRVAKSSSKARQAPAKTTHDGEDSDFGFDDDF